MKNRFDLIIFDWDGTLVDSIDWIVSCLQHAATVCDYPVPERDAAKDVIGLSTTNAIQTLFPATDEEARNQLMSCYIEAYFARKISRADLFAGVYEMLVQLKQTGFRLAVATGKSRRGLDKALRATGTEDLFHITRCADETASKPDPAMVLDIMRHMNAGNERTLMVGDSVHDMQMALNARISSVAVSCGAHSRDILQKYDPLICLQQPAELLAIIGG